MLDPYLAQELGSHYATRFDGITRDYSRPPMSRSCAARFAFATRLPKRARSDSGIYSRPKIT